MIRRNIKFHDGADGWILISQIEHAHLAGQLAEIWTAEPAAALRSVYDELLPAIYHHDDGWDEWERNPAVDARLGHPLEFTELPTAESLAIWRRSIAIGEQIGPLAAYVIAGHFCNLLEKSSVWQSDDDGGGMVRAWSREFRGRQTGWLDQWQSQGRDTNKREMADSSLSFLQSLDAASLWFCCAERTDRYHMKLPGRAPVSFAPQLTYRVRVNAWPFRGEEQEISVHGARMRAARFATPSEFATAQREPVQLSWRLCRS